MKGKRQEIDLTPHVVTHLEKLSKEVGDPYTISDLVDLCCRLGLKDVKRLLAL